MPIALLSGKPSGEFKDYQQKIRNLKAQSHTQFFIWGCFPLSVLKVKHKALLNFTVFYCHHVENFQQKWKVIFPDWISFSLPLANWKILFNLTSIKGEPWSHKCPNTCQNTCKIFYCPYYTLLLPYLSKISVSTAELVKSVTAWLCLPFHVFRCRFLCVVCRNIQTISISVISFQKAMKRMETLLQKGISNKIT